MTSIRTTRSTSSFFQTQIPRTHSVLVPRPTFLGCASPRSGRAISYGRPDKASTFGGMDNRSKAPYLAQDPEEIGQVIAALNNASKKGKAKLGFGCRKKTYQISDKDTRSIDSWSLNDWDYKKPNLPTYARGLFTHANNGKPEIACRGYNKFFNVGEVNTTQWRNVEQNTRGPYELSVKENGCIIFIGGLDDETIIITSKHSTGPRSDGSANHAAAGEQWIDRQLKGKGKTRADLAKTLRAKNVTVVAELCDDSFEEHVLEYPPQHAGLYLHGMNLNLPEFATCPGNLVHQFADEWGFRKVQYVMKDTIDQVKPFLDEIGKTGSYEGRMTEGFVIRCQARETKDTPWHDWFFKYKFDEPYLMYRQWREVTKAIIAGKPPKYNKHKKITEEYINYARRQLSRDPSIGKRFNQNHGIIAMRDGFLAEKGVKGHEIIQSEEQDGEGPNAGHVTRNVVVIPIATIGCGKTTVAIAICRLFGWGHIQNDNIEGKGKPKRFAMAITNEMAGHPAVVADRNNHQRRERAQIFEDIGQVVPDATYVGLHYVHDRGNYADIRRAMQDRVLARGDKHQTIHADSKGQEEVIGIMDGFLQRFEPVDIEKGPDKNFDVVVDLDVTATSRENLATVIHQIHDNYPKLFEVPDEEAMDQAIEYALNQYAPTIKHDISQGGKKENSPKTNGKPQANGTPKVPGPKKESRVEFFCISLPAPRVTSILDAVFNSETAETTRFYTQLKAGRRIQKAFHVTLIHKASERAQPDYWAKLNKLWKSEAEGQVQPAFIGGTDGGVEMGKVKVQLERVVWDERVMAIVARLIDAGEFKTVNKMAHVTVGTASDAVKPKESNDLLEAWLEAWLEGHGDGKIKDVKIKDIVVLDGVAKGMLSR